MNAYELLEPDHSPADVWACGKCNKVYATGYGKRSAEHCCDFRCVSCGNPCVEYYTRCNPCIERERAEKESKAFAGAEKVEGWNGWVWTDATSRNEGFFEDVGQLVEWFDEQDADNDGSKPVLPSYAWVCESTAFVQLSLDRILEGIEEDDDAFEDCRDRFKGVKELGDAIKAFNEANKEVVSYHPCSNRVVLIHSEPRP